MKRHFYISDNLPQLDTVEAELESQGFLNSQIHVYTNDDAGVDMLKHLHNMEAVLKKDVVYGTVRGAILGLLVGLIVLGMAWMTGWYATVTWVPFVFLAIVVLGFCTWEGGFLGIQEMHRDFRRFEDAIGNGRHIFFVDAADDQAATLDRVVSQHGNLVSAGVGSPTPALVVKAQEKWKEFLHVMP